MILPQDTKEYVVGYNERYVHNVEKQDNYKILVPVS